MKQLEGGNPKQRKTRSDKKVSAAPYISAEYRVWIHRIARRLEIPEGDVGIRLIDAALNDEGCLEFFRQYFKRPYQMLENHVMYPSIKPGNVYNVLDINTDAHVRFKVKLSKPLAEKLAEFQYALGISFFAHAVKALLEFALKEIRIIRKVAPGIEYGDFRKTLPSGQLNTKPTVWSIFK